MSVSLNMSLVELPPQLLRNYRPVLGGLKAVNPAMVRLNQQFRLKIAKFWEKFRRDAKELGLWVKEELTYRLHITLYYLREWKSDWDEDLEGYEWFVRSIMIILGIVLVLVLGNLITTGQLPF